MPRLRVYLENNQKIYQYFWMTISTKPGNFWVSSILDSFWNANINRISLFQIFILFDKHKADSKWTAVEQGRGG